MADKKETPVSRCSSVLHCCCCCAVALSVILCVGLILIASPSMKGRNMVPTPVPVPVPFRQDHVVDLSGALPKILACMKKEHAIPYSIPTLEAMMEHVKQSLIDAAGFAGINGVGPPLAILDKVLRCTSKGNDNQQCCRGEGVVASCLPFCDGSVPVSKSAVSLGLSGLKECGNHYLNQIVDCHVKNNQAQ